MTAELSKVNQKAQSKIAQILLERVSSYGLTDDVREIISSLALSLESEEILRLHALLEDDQSAISSLLLAKLHLQKSDQYAAQLIEQDIRFRTISIRSAL